MPDPVDPNSAPIGTRCTAADLLVTPLPVESPSERFGQELLRRIEAEGRQGFSPVESLRRIFSPTILPEETLRDLATAIVSGTHLLFFGPSGAGKTSLAKALWALFPKDVWVVDGCPVLDDPRSLVVPEAFARYPPCPICRRRFGGEGAGAPPFGDPARIPALRFRLREGFGLARLQGSSEVFPDYLTGNVNLRKLEELGDPMSPLVLEPGKLLQANRGLLLIDEIGKLPLGTQNVLLQALQEGTVTPAKSRESFPGLFVAVTTSNLSDLDNINDPLSDRLTSLLVPYNPRHADNLRIVWANPPPAIARAHVPTLLVDAGVRVIETWRLKMAEDNPDVGEVGSNRTLLDLVQRTSAVAELAGHRIAEEADLRAGLLHAMRGRIRARSGETFRQNEKRVREFVDSYLRAAVDRSALVYWCRFYRDALHGDARAAAALVQEGKAALASGAIAEASAGPLVAFAEYVREREADGGEVPPADLALATFRLLDAHSLFSCEKEVDDDAPL